MCRFNDLKFVYIFYDTEKKEPLLEVNQKNHIECKEKYTVKI